MTPDKRRADSTLQGKIAKILLGWQKLFRENHPTEQLTRCISRAENVPTCLGRHQLVFLKGEFESKGETHGGVVINASNSPRGDGRLFDRTVNYQGVFQSRFIHSLVLYTLQQH